MRPPSSCAVRQAMRGGHTAEEVILDARPRLRGRVRLEVVLCCRPGPLRSVAAACDGVRQNCADSTTNRQILQGLPPSVRSSAPDGAGGRRPTEDLARSARSSRVITVGVTSPERCADSKGHSKPIAHQRVADRQLPIISCQETATVSAAAPCDRGT
eukprot:3684268-Prymnesium_polylepis.1